MKQTALLVLSLFLITSTVAALTLINSCGTDVNNLTDTRWQLNANLTSTNTTCIDLNTSNVDVDCNGFTIGNTNSTLQQIGINVSATNVTLHGCTITGFEYFDTVLFTNFGKAVQVNASNFTMYNSTLDNSYYFVFFAFGPGATTNHTFYDLTFINQSGIGQAAFKSAFGSEYLSNSTFYNLRMENMSGQGFSIQNSDVGISVFNSTFKNVTNDVIVLAGNGTQIYNNTFNITNTAITTYGGDNLIYNNTFFNVTAGILISGNNTKVYNNIIRNTSFNSNGGIVAFGPNQQIYNNTIENIQTPEAPAEFNLRGAISASSSDNLTTFNNLIRNSTFGITAASNANLTSFNDIILTPILYDYITLGGGMLNHFSNITVINSTFRANASGLNVTGNGSINVKQIINLTIYNMSTAVVNEDFMVQNSSGVQLYGGLTNAQGTALFNLTLLTVDENGITNHTPHNFTYDNGTAVLYNRTNVTYQNTYFPVIIGGASEPTTQCVTLSAPNTVTTLTANESVSNTVCLNVTAQNVQINCNGYYINSAGPNAKYAIFSNSTNTSIVSCNFRDYSANSSGYAAYSEGANFTIYNSTFYNSSGGAYAVANYANFTNNTFTLNNATAIYTAGANTSIQNNLIYNTSLYGSAVTIGDQTNFANNNISLAREVGQDEFALVAIGTAINITSNFIDSQNLAIYGNIAHYVNITNNTLNSSLGSVLINAAEGAYISNNTFLQCGTKCITLRSNDLAFITKNNFTQKSTQGDITLESTNNSNFSLNNFQSGIGSITYNASSAQNNTIYSENLSYSATAFNLNYSSNFTAINITFTPTAITIEATSNLTIKQPLNISTRNSTTALETTNVNVSNSTILINGTSDSNGQFYTNATTLSYQGSAIPTNHSQVNITAYKNGYTTNSTLFNLNSTQINGAYQTLSYQNISIELTAVRPAVTFVNPENNSNISSTINLNATVTTTLWISAVQFNITNSSGVQTTRFATNTSATNWNTTLNTATLQDGNYTINIIANDSSNNINSTVNLTIRIDNTKPTIANATNTTPDTTSITITWDTDEPANTTVAYGTTTALGSSTINSTNATAHSISLSALTSATTYYYNITSCDLAGNCNTTGPHNFNTTTPTVSSSGGGGSNDFHDKNGNTTNITNLIIQNNTVFKTSSTRNQTPDAPLNKPAQETTQQEETRQTPAPFPYELIILLVLLLAIAIGAYKLHQYYTRQKSTSKLVDEINKSYEQPIPKPQPAVQTMTRPIPPQVVQPQNPTGQIPTKPPTNDAKKPTKIELYSQLPEIHTTQSNETNEIDWNIDENDKLDLNIQQEELSLSQKAINKIKKIFH